MALTLEDKKELSYLSGYFKKLEIKTNHLGVNIDDLISEYRDNGYALDVEKERLERTNNRKDAFRQASAPKVEKTKAVKAK